MFGLGGQELVIILLILVFPVMFIWALINVLKSEFAGYNKIIWILVIILTAPIGPLLYMIIGRSQRIKK